MVIKPSLDIWILIHLYFKLRLKISIRIWLKDLIFSISLIPRLLVFSKMNVQVKLYLKLSIFELKLITISYQMEVLDQSIRELAKKVWKQWLKIHILIVLL